MGKGQVEQEGRMRSSRRVRRSKRRVAISNRIVVRSSKVSRSKRNVMRSKKVFSVHLYTFISSIFPESEVEIFIFIYNI